MNVLVLCWLTNVMMLLIMQQRRMMRVCWLKVFSHNEHSIVKWDVFLLVSIIQTHQIKLCHANNVGFPHWHTIKEPVNLSIWIRVDGTVNFRFEPGCWVHNWFIDAYFRRNWVWKIRGNHRLSSFNVHFVTTKSSHHMKNPKKKVNSQFTTSWSPVDLAAPTPLSATHSISPAMS